MERESEVTAEAQREMKELARSKGLRRDEGKKEERKLFFKAMEERPDRRERANEEGKKE